MTVANLQKLLDDVAQFLTVGKAVKQVTDELNRVRTGLAPFAHHSLDDFAAFLSLANKIADEFRRTGQVPVPPVKPKRGTSAKPVVEKPPKTSTADALEQVRRLYATASSHPLTDAQLDAQLAPLIALTKPQLVEVAGAANAGGKAKNLSKPDILAGIAASIRKLRDTRGLDAR
jgi:hypothetical protein